MVREACQDYYRPYYYFFFLASFSLPEMGIAVELGVEKGRASACLALSKQTQVFGIDHHFTQEASQRQDRFDNFTYLNQPSLPVPEMIQDKRIAFLHVDTEHSFAMAREEFNAYKPLLTNPAIVVFDDLHAAEDDVLKFFMSLPYPKIQDDRMHPITGWGVMLYVA